MQDLQVQKYIKAYQQRARLGQEIAKRRAVRAAAIALSCAEKLVNEFGAQRVFLFGSLAEERFRAASDIDLVVEGLVPALFFKASAKISRLAGDIEVDLIPFEAYKYQAEVLANGKLLYESNRSKSITAVDGDGTERNGKTARIDR